MIFLGLWEIKATIYSGSVTSAVLSNIKIPYCIDLSSSFPYLMHDVSVTEAFVQYMRFSQVQSISGINKLKHKLKKTTRFANYYTCQKNIFTGRI